MYFNIENIIWKMYFYFYKEVYIVSNNKLIERDQVKDKFSILISIITFQVGPTIISKHLYPK